MQYSYLYIDNNKYIHTNTLLKDDRTKQSKTKKKIMFEIKFVCRFIVSVGN